MVGAKGCLADLRASLALMLTLVYPTTRATNPPQPKWDEKADTTLRMEPTMVSVGES
jgi:hypothetical protein